MERKGKRLSKVVLVIVFVGLLATTLFLSQKSLFYQNNVSKNQALTEYGFYLDAYNEQAHINFKHQSPELDPQLQHIAPQIASMGASVAISDFDKDGWNDIYFTNSGTGSKNVLYHNQHNGMFEEVGEAMGLADVNKKGTGVSMGAIWGDYDNDGYEDLLLYKWGKPELFKNNGGKSFISATEGSGLPDWVNANAAIWLDFNNDGLLDLFLGGYYPEKFDLQHLTTTKIMPESFEYANNGGRNYLLKNEGNGKFKDVTREYGLSSTRWTLAAGAADLTGDNFPELIVANDYGVDEFYVNLDGKKFEERGRQVGIGYTPKSGMNVSFGDVDNTNDLGIYVTNITEKGILLQGNSYWKPKKAENHDISFINLAKLAGIESGGWSYCAQFGDLNNDGFLDLYVANGFISGKKGTSYWYDYSKIVGGHQAIIEDARNWPAMEGKSHAGYQQNKIWINNDYGLFKEVSDQASPAITLDSRAVALADLWNHGELDVIVANQNNIPTIFKNHVTPNNHWIAFDLEGTVSNRSAIGAKVTLEWNDKKQTQVVTGGIGFSAQNQHRIHFGIGKSNQVSHVIINWPSGQVQEIENPVVDKVHHITEDKINI